MDVYTIVEQLKEEVARIENAIAALMGLGWQPAGRRGPGRPRGVKNAAKPRQKKRTMSAASRKRISEAMKQRWAKQKGKSARGKATLAKKANAPATKSTARRGMSPAMRKKLSALMKERWAARKRAAGARAE